MTLKAIQALTKMSGGSQSHLMLCSDSKLWVVKFLNNSQHPYVLAKELITARIARSIGLSVPRSELVEIDIGLIKSNPDTSIQKSNGSFEQCSPGLHFGSRFVGGLMPGKVLDFLPKIDSRTVTNYSELAGALVLDIWTCNVDYRQIVFRRRGQSKSYKMFFIDHGHCLNFGQWKVAKLPHRRFYRQQEAYEGVQNWDMIGPWLDRVRSIDATTLRRALNQVPEEWGFGTRSDLDALAQRLSARARDIGDLVSEYID